MLLVLARHFNSNISLQASSLFNCIVQLLQDKILLSKREEIVKEFKIVTSMMSVNRMMKSGPRCLLIDIRKKYRGEHKEKNERKISLLRYLLTKNLMPEEIVGITRETGQITFIIKWRNEGDVAFVSAKEAHEKYPDLVVKFYEDRVLCSAIDESIVFPEGGFARNLEPERILSALSYGEKIVFYMKWHGSDVADFVSADEAKYVCPELVCEFYERKIKWIN